MKDNQQKTTSKRSLANIAKRTDLDRDVRLRMWYLYDMLYKKTDEEHALTTPQIVRLMQEDYGIYVHRTTVPYDIALLEAAGVKISFYYFDYDNKKQHILKNDGKPYTVSPYDLIWDGDFYYLVGYCDEREAMRTFRVDRIEDVPEITEEALTARPDDYSISRYTKESLRMFSGSDLKTVTMRFDAVAMKWVIDRFGPYVDTKPIGDDAFELTADICVGPTFYSWVFGMNGAAVIEGPEEVKAEYRAMIEKALGGTAD